TLGFCAMTGVIETSQAGYTGDGYVNTSGGLSESITWSVNASSAGVYSIAWRYSFGGFSTNLRDAKLVINGTTAVNFIEFPYTGAWSNWFITIPVDVLLNEGYNQLRLEATLTTGLANIDNIRFYTDSLTPTGCTPSYIITVNANDPAGGTVSYDPVQDYYDEATPITLTASANPGYIFQSWTGDVTSTQNPHTFSIAQNTIATAIFLPEGTAQHPDLIGYASIQDDNGTPYIVTGGSLGSTVTAATLQELKDYSASADPLVIQFSGMFEAADEIKISSNKTLLGIGDNAYLKGIELEINGARNVIVRNVKVSHVIAEGSSIANDAIVITGKSKNIWIDHCELFSDREHDDNEDYYDGLLEIKNESSFITVSYCVFHNHMKTSLISSGDSQIADAVIRATYHHNYFYNCNSRLPSIRFGKAHIFNNYYLNNDSTGINSRMGAQVRVEDNYFQNTKDPIGSWYSTAIGYWDVNNNTYNACPGEIQYQPTESTCTYTVPYSYTLDDVSTLPTAVPGNAGVGKL
ncbi:MAG: hypothetical protein JXB50_04715, partial [Spirochaetes bacterium]|nr:hypothetical protein [Spirochaetota bacterium]